MGGDCKSPGSAFEGSNPSPATKLGPVMHMLHGRFFLSPSYTFKSSEISAEGGQRRYEGESDGERIEAVPILR